MRSIQCAVRLLAVVMSVSVFAASSLAGTIRHDVADQNYLDLGASSAYASVGRVLIDVGSDKYLASGVLIASDWVLTAAHVVDDATALTFELGGKSYAADKWLAHKKWDGDLNKGYDIGLMHFTTSITSDTGIGSATRYAGSDELGEVGTFAGYGTTGTGLTGWTTYDGQKRAGRNTLDRFLRTGGKESRVLMADFDNPDDPDDSRWDPTTPLPMEYLISPGDSAGVCS